MPVSGVAPRVTPSTETEHDPGLAFTESLLARADSVLRVATGRESTEMRGTWLGASTSTGACAAALGVTTAPAVADTADPWMAACGEAPPRPKSAAIPS